MHRFCGQEGGRQGGLEADRRSRLRAELSTVACQSMSTWLGGARGRFSPTKDVDQGVFHRGLSINANVELDGVPRDISVVRAAESVLR